MNVLLVARDTAAPSIMIVIFWLLLILWALGSFLPIPPQISANVDRVASGIVLVLLAILGFYVFGSPFH